MQTELRPVEGYLENVLDFLQHSDIIRSCLIELNISEEKKSDLEKWFLAIFYFVHFPIEIPIVVNKKLPPWEGKVLEQKQK